MRIPAMFNNSDDSAAQETLRQAIGATRRASAAEVLSAPARVRILAAARRQADQPVGLFPSLFAAPRRLLAVAALPLLLAVGMLVLLNQSTPVRPVLGEFTIEASKEADRVFFRVANGSNDHIVYRSTVPDRFERSSGVPVTDGAFTDTLDDQADLVFYKIY